MSVNTAALPKKVEMSFNTAAHPQNKKKNEDLGATKMVCLLVKIAV